MTVLQYQQVFRCWLTSIVQTFFFFAFSWTCVGVDAPVISSFMREAWSFVASIHRYDCDVQD
jgi:hypothetical protein